ncbi:MAG: 3-deoxy-7-phosphoheptulonate synthase [Elusimicrobia bacterium CG1_02_63_36]|nr:MAG: 3-deoxy-7-phosphoheptulonate synthase [Elusimicrobia bacterium CG1_02_63_36]PIP81828.1 MAG: 3-deoxy-7-phosphoheptulonate synthase [Elusimicrobia bacterium CG22_combo_CG10-13_8_21_14_all_63_91]PJA11505.1 MAG: 3-deoxy-7-phosphoheptulonate synthase [Elusimicrobia bacterium CG_4_10_14_0_2_um_filter_63_34]PJB24340.1 MAG: 3-deoxy-7-phosphoheptulonate synthase [Elusimicrobia bacterium CG_4_9_14_3_um_filter_62_55]
MVILLEPDRPDHAAIVKAVRSAAARFAGVKVKPYEFSGTTHAFTEVHLVGRTETVPAADFEAIPGVLRVVRVSSKYRIIGRHGEKDSPVGFDANGVRFDDFHLTVIAGLCAVDTRRNVDAMFSALAKEGLTAARMGAYKPRTSPYDFQGLGAKCLPTVFELAGKRGIRLVAMEVTDIRQIDEVHAALKKAGGPTQVLFQVGTRNAQNFELLKALGKQKAPVLFKRGMGITLEESLNACEYIASEGNPNIVFCLRGVKSHLGDPHRNLVDFAHVPVVRRQTRMPVCVDPSHSVGSMRASPDGIPDVFHATAQGVISGASSVLVDFHPNPKEALCDGPQALTLDRLRPFLDYVGAVRRTYEELVRIVS